MTTKKIPISLNDDEQKAITEVADMIGIAGVYGEIPKTLRFGITMARAYAEAFEKFIPDLEMDELDQFFTMLKAARKRRKALESLATAQKHAEKYNPSPAKSIPNHIPNGS